MDAPDDLPSALSYAKNATNGAVSSLRILDGAHLAPVLAQFLADLRDRYEEGGPERTLLQGLADALPPLASSAGWSLTP